MSQCPRSNLLLSLCLLLGLTVSLGEGQTLERIASAHEPAPINHNGDTFPITSIGSGAGDFNVPPRPWICYTTGGNTNVVWQFPDGTTLPQQPSGVAGASEFYYSLVDNGRVVLYRGANRLSPVGEYCCVRTGTDQRLCATFIAGSCPILSAPTNGAVTYSAPVSPTETTVVATYSCDTGYNMIGSAQRTCEDATSYSGTDPTCQPVDCGPLTGPDNGGVMYSMGTSYQSVATYTCNTGYTRTGDMTSSCGDDGQWTSATVSCDIVDCNSLPNPPNGQVSAPATTYQSEATYSCNSGYSLVGSMSQTCGSNGQWSSTEPTCTALCPRESPLNGMTSYSVQTDPPPVGTLATYSCDNGYELSGNEMRTCVDNTGWSGSLPTCNPVDCGPLSITNGQVTTPSGTTFMNTASYSCNSGYEINGDMTRTCGADGNWSPAEPTCDPVDCGPLSVTNGRVIFSGGTTYLNNATYSCDPGYTLNGTNTRFCAANGMWSPPSSSVPTCDPVDCGPLSIPNGRVITSGGTTFMNTATYSCNSGYTLNSSSTRVCGSDGMWTLVTPTCIPILAMVSSSSGPPMAGQSYSLTCTVTGADSLSPTISYQWTQGQTQVGTNSMMLTFDPLVLSDVGLYRCEASVRSDLLSQDFTAVSDNHEIKFESLNIQLRFNGILNCREYTLLNPGLKTSDITNKLVRGVEALCGCGFNSSFISDTSLQCFEVDSPDHVTYRGVVSGTSNISTVEIVSYIDQWTKTTLTVVVQSVRLRINNTCPIALTDLDSPECPEAIDVRSTTPPTTDPTAAPALGAIIGGVVCGVLVLVIVAAVIVIVLLIARRQTTTGSKDIKTTEVPLSDLPQTSPTPLQVEDNHEYEDLSKFQEEENYEQVGQPRPPKGGYDLTSCPAYAPSTGGRGQTTPTT